MSKITKGVLVAASVAAGLGIHPRSAVAAEGDLSYSDGESISGTVAIRPASGETVTFSAAGTVTMPSSTTRSTDWPFAFYDTNGNVV